MNNGNYVDFWNMGSQPIIEQPLGMSNNTGIFSGISDWFKSFFDPSKDLLSPSSVYSPNNNSNIDPNTNKGFFSDFDLGTAIQGLQALSGLWGAYNMNKQYNLARDSLNFQKDAWTKNYTNSIKDYNNLLADKYRGRASQETGNINAYNSEYEKNKL